MPFGKTIAAGLLLSGASLLALAPAAAQGVADNGAGVSAAIRDSLFSKFGRDWLNSAPAQGGSGLGLAICRQIAERLGGTIRLAETSPAGSRFELRLPLAVTAPARPADAMPA